MKKIKKQNMFVNQMALIAVVLLISTYSVHGQERAAIEVGNPLGLMVDDEFRPMSSNVKVYGAIYHAESCIYDKSRDLLIVPSQGVRQNVLQNDAWVSLINPDGTVHTSKWIGLQNPGQRGNSDPALVFNDPLGSEIANGVLYFADRDGGTSEDEASVAVIRRFDLKTGAPIEDIRIEGSPWINDLTVLEDGTIYTTQTGEFGEEADPDSWRVWKISPQGEASVFAQGSPLLQPNGIAIDPDGNVVVANFGNPDVLTYSPEGDLLKKESAVQAGSDGLEIMADGTKYICSVRQGGVSRIRPGQSAELIAENIPSAASMCYDSKSNQLVIPMTSQSGLAFIPLD
ncbi:MAG TPA: SMP-30/gluconolactonase/LRE family protein [Membranihabitans sp.]|nr:SMP-30/gluconolactonase/LRE family protein [Membranihabitans sp.]